MDNDTLDRTDPMQDAPSAAASQQPSVSSESEDFDTTLKLGGAAATEGDTTDRTLQPEGTAMPMATDDPVAPSTFHLKGEDYEQVKVLSTGSGEAQVYLVSRGGEEYVLKIYYPNFSVDRKLMQIIRSFQFEMIVRLLDYGKTYVDGKSRNYELMEYMRGGTLRDTRIGGDMKLFRRVALQGAAALAYCHTNNVLHKDVKPSNLFFRDKDREQLVLGDFGISAMRGSEGQNFRTTQARTPIYAAPEMYVDVIDGEVDITPAADYYSLGMSLFAAWLGENPMSNNERTMMRQKSEGRLPRLNELPPAVRQLVQGLTAVNPQSRWGYDEVERWFRGEDVQVDISSPYLKYKSFLVDPERNLVAENVHELVPMLIDNERLAMNYLYNGQIVNWLTTCGNTRLSAIVSDIVTNRYPADRKAGLMASCYAMEPSLCYRDISGMECDDVHSIALSVLASKERYALQLQNRNDSLFLWLEGHTRCDIDRLRSYFHEGDSSEQGRVAALRLVYEIDPDVPFINRRPSSTVRQIVSTFGSGDLGDDEWQSVCDGRLLSWLYGHEDLMAAESLRILTDGKLYSPTLAYKVLYNLDREAAFDLSTAYTPADVGRLLAQQMQQAEHVSAAELGRQMTIYTDPTGRFYYYAQLHGWNDLITEATRCFDLNSDENRERLSAYDLRTALYRFCCILGHKPAYLMPDGTQLADGRNLAPASQAMLRQEIYQGALPQWMSVFYHEDPSQEFAEEYSYEKSLEAWVQALGGIYPQQTYYRRYTKAREDTRQRVEEVSRLWKKANRQEQTWQYVFYSACAVWAILVCVSGLDDRTLLFQHHMRNVILPLGIPTGIICATHAYFKGYGTLLSTLAGVLGLATAAIPCYLLRAVDGSAPRLFHIAVLAITAVYMLVSYFTDMTRGYKNDAQQLAQMARQEDIKSTLLEPLYYTFKTRSVRYSASRFGILDELSDHVRSLSGESVIHYMLWSLLAAVMIANLLLLRL